MDQYNVNEHRRYQGQSFYAYASEHRYVRDPTQQQRYEPYVSPRLRRQANISPRFREGNASPSDLRQGNIQQQYERHENAKQNSERQAHAQQRHAQNVRWEDRDFYVNLVRFDQLGNGHQHFDQLVNREQISDQYQQKSNGNEVGDQHCGLEKLKGETYSTDINGNHPLGYSASKFSKKSELEGDSAKWTRIAVIRLIQLYQDEEKVMKKIKRKVQNKSIDWEGLARKMNKEGHAFTAEQCEEKVRDLRATFISKESDKNRDV